jgi:hypothetical protein
LSWFIVNGCRVAECQRASSTCHIAVGIFLFFSIVKNRYRLAEESIVADAQVGSYQAGLGRLERNLDCRIDKSCGPGAPPSGSIATRWLAVVRAWCYTSRMALMAVRGLAILSPFCRQGHFRPGTPPGLMTWYTTTVLCTVGAVQVRYQSGRDSEYCCAQSARLRVFFCCSRPTTIEDGKRRSLGALSVNSLRLLFARCSGSSRYM